MTAVDPPSENPASRNPGAHREPTRDELLAMAYADGELAEDARREFESRLKTEEHLGREVAAQLRLAVIAREVAIPEPMDYEWERIAEDPMNKASLGLGWGMLIVGAFGLAGWGTLELMQAELPMMPKLLLFALLAGGLVLLGLTVRNRLRTLPFDPYTEVKR